MNKPCAFPGCPAVLAKGVRYCADHKQRGVASDDQHRPGSAQRGYNTRWHKLRNATLAAQPLCYRCQELGLTTPATLVHHKDSNPFNSRAENLLSLCRSCHTLIHNGERGA